MKKSILTLIIVLLSLRLFATDTLSIRSTFEPSQILKETKENWKAFSVSPDSVALMNFRAKFQYYEYLDYMEERINICLLNLPIDYPRTDEYTKMQLEAWRFIILYEQMKVTEFQLYLIEEKIKGYDSGANNY